MMCQYCGRINPEASEVCQACGSNLKAAPSAPADQTATTVPPAGVPLSATAVQPAPAAAVKSPEAPPAMPAAPAAVPLAEPLPPLQSGIAALPVSYAGFWPRFAACLIDGIILLVPIVVYWIVVLTPKIESILGPSLELVPFGSDGLPTPELLALFRAELFFAGFVVLVSWLYYSIMESSKLQASVGKMAMGIKVTDVEGRRISFARATGRSLARLLSGMIFLIGFIIAAFTAKKQAMHDLIVSTLVVVKEK